MKRPPASRIPSAVASRRRATASALALLMVLAASGSAVMLGQDRPVAPVVVAVEDPALDLLSWLPASAGPVPFAAWFGEAGDSGPAAPASPTGRQVFRDQAALGLRPFPRTLGLGRGWEPRFGWDATDVTGWATAGSDAVTTVLTGRFDTTLIESRLRAGGYERRTDGPAVIWSLPGAAEEPIVEGDDPGAARAVGLLAGRIITGPDIAAVEAAVRTATGRLPSVLEHPAVAGLVPVLAEAGAPVAVMSSGAAAVAATCAGAVPGDQVADPAGRAVSVIYFEETATRPRSTAVVVTAPAAATVARVTAGFERDWSLSPEEPVVAVGGIVAPVSALGTVSGVRSFPRAAVVSFTGGRGDGWAVSWVPAAVRFAGPVCRAVAGATVPAGTPVATPASDTE